jgi:hypothetical protein
MPIESLLTRHRYWNVRRTWDLQLHHREPVIERKPSTVASVEKHVWIQVQAICISRNVSFIYWTGCVSLDQGIMEPGCDGSCRSLSLRVIVATHPTGHQYSTPGLCSPSLKLPGKRLAWQTIIQSTSIVYGPKGDNSQSTLLPCNSARPSKIR